MRLMMGIAIGYALRFHLEIYDGIVYAGILVNFPHYYLEGFIWKRDSPHRANIAFRD